MVAEKQKTIKHGGMNMDARIYHAKSFIELLRRWIDNGHFLAERHLRDKSLGFIFQKLTEQADDYSFGYFGCGEYSQATAMADTIKKKEEGIISKIETLLYDIEATLFSMEVDILKIGEDVYRFHGVNYQGYVDSGANKEAQRELSVFYEIWKSVWKDLKESQRLDGNFPSDETYTSCNEKIIGAIKLLDGLTGENTTIRYLSREREEREKKWKEERERLEALGKSLADYEKSSNTATNSQPPKRWMVDPNEVCIRLNKKEG